MRHLPIYLILSLIIIPIAVLIALPFGRYIPKDNTPALFGISFLATVVACFIVWLCIFVPMLLIARLRYKRKK